jgi:hypothetical protein
MSKFGLILVFMIVAILVTGSASAQPAHDSTGGRAAISASGKTDVAKVLKHCRAHPGVSFVIQPNC